MNPEYLGDGVYAHFDGWYVWLTTGSHLSGEADNKIALEPAVLLSLERYLTDHKAWLIEVKKEESGRNKAQSSTI